MYLSFFLIYRRCDKKICLFLTAKQMIIPVIPMSHRQVFLIYYRFLTSLYLTLTNKVQYVLPGTTARYEYITTGNFAICAMTLHEKSDNSIPLVPGTCWAGVVYCCCPLFEFEWSVSPWPTMARMFVMYYLI